MSAYEFHTSFDMHNIRELGLRILHPGRLITSYGFSALSFIAAIVYFAHSPFLIIEFVIAGMLFLFMPLIVARRVRRITLKRAEETNSIVTEFIYHFDDEQILAQNLTTGSSHSLAYNHLLKVEETANYYFLYTRQYQFLVIAKSDVDSEKREEWLDFLRSKGLKIHCKKK